MRVLNIDPNIKFSRVIKGYDPREVDGVLDAVFSENAALKQTVSQYEAKIQQLGESTNRLEQERIQESLRLTGLMSNATRMANQIKAEAGHQADGLLTSAQREAGELRETTRFESERIRENAQIEAEKIRASAKQKSESARFEALRIIETANREAEKIRSQARVDFATVETALLNLIEDAKIIRKHNEQYISVAVSQLDKITLSAGKALSGIPAALPSPETEKAPFLLLAPPIPQGMNQGGLRPQPNSL